MDVEHFEIFAFFGSLEVKIGHLGGRGKNAFFLQNGACGRSKVNIGRSKVATKGQHRQIKGHHHA